MTSSNISKMEREIIKDFKNQLVQKLGDNIISIQLFGSKVREDSHRESDIDILIVLKRVTEKNKKLILDITVKILLGQGINISPHIYSQEEFHYLNNISSVFMQILQREAIPL